MFHLALHFLVPAAVTALFFRRGWKAAYLILIATMAVDVDHLLADPIYDPSRCSIGFHPLHEPWFILFYLALCFVPKTKLIGIGLCIHMALDAADCRFTNGSWMHQALNRDPVNVEYLAPSPRHAAAATALVER